MRITFEIHSASWKKEKGTPRLWQGLKAAKKKNSLDEEPENSILRRYSKLGKQQRRKEQGSAPRHSGVSFASRQAARVRQ